MIGQKPTHPLRLHHVAFIFPPFDTMCAAGIGRTAQETPGTGVPAQTACRGTYGLLLYAVRALHPTIRGGRSHLPHGTNRTPRTSQRCDPEGTYADVAQLAEHRARRYAQVQVLPSAPNPKADSVQGQYCGKPILGERCVPSAGRGSAKGRSICPR